MTNWPWPLSLVQDWFESLWDWIAEASEDAVQVVRTWVSESQMALEDLLASQFSWVGDKFDSLVGWLAERLDTLSDVSGQIFDDLTGWLSDRLQTVTQQAAEAVENAIPTLVDAVATATAESADAILSSIASVSSQVVDTGEYVIGQLANAFDCAGETVAEAIGQAVTGLGGAVWSGLWGALEPILGQLPEAATVGARRDISRGVGAAEIRTPGLREWAGSWVKSLQGSPETPIDVVNSLYQGLMHQIHAFFAGQMLPPAKAGAEEMAQYAENWLNLAWDTVILTTLVDASVEAFSFGQVEVVGRAARTLASMFPVGDVARDIATTPLRAGLLRWLDQHWNSVYQLRSPGLAELARFVARGVMGRDEAYTVAAKQGYNKMWLDRAVQASYRLPGPDDLARMLWRRVITADEMKSALVAQGVPDEWADRIIRATPQIPPYSDLVRFTVREDLGPEWLAEQLQKIGYAREWADHIWNSHWVLPGTRELYEMAAKGIIDQGTLRKQLIINDLHPDWIERLIQNQYIPIPRVDLRRGWEAGLISDDELERRYRALRYSPDDARIMSDIARRFALQAEISAVERENDKNYLDGFIDLATYEANLRQLGYSELRIRYKVAYIQQRAQRELAREHIDILRTKYRKGLIPVNEFRLGLAQLGLRPEVVQAIVELEEARKGID